MKGTIALAAAATLFLGNPVSAGLSVIDQRGGGGALIVSSEDGAGLATQRLATVLGQHYGMGGRRLTYLAGTEATAANLEGRVFQAIRALQPRDVLLVVVALPVDQREAGRESILVTSGYDPDKPWTGLPTIALRNLALKASAGALVMVYPDCASSRSVSEYFAANSLRSQTLDRSSQALVTYCPSENADVGQFLNLLARELEKSAEQPVTRGPWQGKNERGLVSVASLIGRLQEAESPFRISIQTSSGGGWLRVYQPGSVADIDPIEAEGQRNRAMDAAMAELSGSAPASQIDAVRVLAEGKWPAAQPEFARLLATSPSADVRIAAARALGLFATDESRVALEVAARDVDFRVRVEAISALARFGGLPQVDYTLSNGLSDDDPRVRAAAAYGLGQHWTYMDVGRAGTVATSVATLVGSDPDENVRAAGAWSLAQGQRSEGLAETRQLAISGTSTKVRVAALEALGELSASDAVSTLATVAQPSESVEQDVQVIRLAAVRSLGKLNTPEADDALLALTKDGDSMVAAAADAALADSRALSKSARDLAVNTSETVERRTLAIRILGRNEAPEAASILSFLLGDENVVIRAEATTALGGRKDAATVRKLGELLQDPLESLEIRALAAQALGRIGTASAHAILAKVVEDKEEGIRAVVATAIGNSPKESRPISPLIRLARDSSSVVRAAAVKSLGRFGADPTARRNLEAIARDDTDPSVRELAVQGLRAVQLDASTLVVAADSVVPNLGPFRPGQRKWRIDVFWCEGPGAENLKQQAETYVTDLAQVSRAMSKEPEVIASIELRSISERMNAFPNYQITQNEVRYELNNEAERKLAERLKESGKAAGFVTRPVTKATPDYLSVFLCSSKGGVK